MGYLPVERPPGATTMITHLSARPLSPEIPLAAIVHQQNRGGDGEFTMTSGTTVFPCQNCGSTMAWDPAARVMACGHCGNRQAVTPAGTAVREHAFAELASLPAKPVAKLGTAFI